MNPKRIYTSSNDELLHIIKNQRQKINRRLRELRNTKGGTNSPAYRTAQKHGLNKRRKGYKLNNEDEAMNEYNRVQAEKEAELNENWLHNKTSTKKGWEKTRQKLLDELGEKNISDRVEKKLWKAYNELVGEYPSEYYRKNGRRHNSDQLIKQIWDEISVDKRYGWENVADRVRERLKQEYEREQEEIQEEEYSQNSTFFNSIW